MYEKVGIMPKKAFLEITNACNLQCSFCHGTKRPIQYMTTPAFRHAASQIRPFADYLYFHLMGEPLLHPHLSDFLAIAGELGFRVILTTNGTLLPKCTPILLSAPALHKVSISLHAYEANDMGIPLEQYLDGCFRLCRDAAAQGIIAVMRLWNVGGQSTANEQILAAMHGFFDTDGTPWQEIYSGYKLREKVFLEWGERFDWPDTDAAPLSTRHSCYGLRDQFGVLVDGTVVPCCLDAEGAAALGNLSDTPLEEILQSPRATALKQSFITKQITEPLCQRCGYAAMKQYR